MFDLKNTAILFIDMFRCDSLRQLQWNKKNIEYIYWKCVHN